MVCVTAYSLSPEGAHEFLKPNIVTAQFALDFRTIANLISADLRSAPLGGSRYMAVAAIRRRDFIAFDYLKIAVTNYSRCSRRCERRRQCQQHQTSWMWGGT